MMKHNCRTELNGVDLKATPIRLEILKLLENTSQPLDVASIQKYLNESKIKSDPVTVFRIVNTFTNKGITKQIQFRDGKARYELLTEDHHHCICEKCSCIEDIKNCSVESLEQEIMDKMGFKVKSHSLEFFGLCKDCQ